MAFEVDPRAPKEYSSVAMLHLNTHGSVEEAVYDYDFYLKNFPVPSVREYQDHVKNIRYSSAAKHWTEETIYMNPSSMFVMHILCYHVPKWIEVEQMLYNNTQQVRQVIRFVLEDLVDNNFLQTQFRVNHLMIEMVEEKKALCSAYLDGLKKAIKPLEMVLKTLKKPCRTLKVVNSQLDKLKSQKKLLEKYAHKWSIVSTSNEQHRERIKKALTTRARAVLWMVKRRMASK